VQSSAKFLALACTLSGDKAQTNQLSCWGSNTPTTMKWGTVAKMPQTDTPDPRAKAKRRSAQLHTTDVSVNHERRVAKPVHGTELDSKQRAARATGRNKRAELRAIAGEVAMAIEDGFKLSSRSIAHVCPLSGRNIFAGPGQDVINS